MKNFMFDHKGVHNTELNFKEKKKKKKSTFTSDHQIHRLKTGKNTSPQLYIPCDHVLYEKKELNYLGIVLN